MPQPSLIVLAHSEGWCSSISRHFGGCQQSWVLSVEDLINESLRLPGSAAIVEAPPRGADNFFLEIFELANNSVQLKIFAVGNRGLLKWRPLLRAAGVVSWHESLLQIPGLVEAIARHHESVSHPAQPLESRVWSDLPWPTAGSVRPA